MGDLRANVIRRPYFTQTHFDLLSYPFSSGTQRLLSDLFRNHAGDLLGERSLSDLLRILQKVDEAGSKFKSLTEAIDTTTPMGRMVMQVVGSFAEFERSIIKERTKLGLARARANGRIGGGRYKLSATQQAEAIKMIRIGEKSQAEIAELFNVDRSTISRMMKEVREKELLKAAR